MFFASAMAQAAIHELAEMQQRGDFAQRIDKLAEQMRGMPQLKVETIHTFGPGFYVRTIKLPAGATLIGKVHATEHIFAVSKGSILLATEDGEQLVHAPFQAVCRPGIARAGHCLTDVWCSNLHINPSNERDLVKLEAMLIAPPRLEEIAA